MTEESRLETMKSRLHQLRAELNVALRLAAPKRVEAIRKLEERFYVFGERSEELGAAIFDMLLGPKEGG